MKFVYFYFRFFLFFFLFLLFLFPFYLFAIFFELLQVNVSSEFCPNFVSISSNSWNNWNTTENRIEVEIIYLKNEEGTKHWELRPLNIVKCIEFIRIELFDSQLNIKAKHLFTFFFSVVAVALLTFNSWSQFMCHSFRSNQYISWMVLRLPLLS